jgi:hypothetical protein
MSDGTPVEAGPPPAGEPLDVRRSLVLLAVMALIAIPTFFPLLGVGLVTNDDLKLSASALDRGHRGVAAVLWAFTRRDGRLDIAQMLSWYVPFVRDSFLYFKTVTLGAIAADIVLFAWFVGSVLRSRRAFFLALLLALVGLQNSWEHTPLTAFPGLLTLTFAYLLASFLAFERFLENGRRRWLLSSALLFLLTIVSYEMYLIYTPVFFLLALHAGRTAREALRSLQAHLAGVGLQLALWTVSHALRTGNYRGVTLAPALDLRQIASVIWQFSISSLPTFFFFNPKYDYLVDAYSKSSSFRGLLSTLDAGMVMKAVLVTGAYAYLMLIPEARAARLRGRPLLAMIVLGVGYFFAPSFLPALTPRYQDEARTQLGMQFSYYSAFAWMWTAVPVMLAASASRRLRWPFTVATGVLLAFASLAIDYTNGMVAEWQAQGRDRIRIVDEFMNTWAYHDIPDGSFIYAPSLWRASGTLNYMGTVIDPRPSSEDRYENFWTYYFNRRGGGKAVIVADRLERMPSDKGFFYLRHVSLKHEKGEYLVYAWVRRTGPALEVLVADRVMVFSRSPWTSSVMGGALAEGAARSVVHLAGGGTRETADVFQFEVENHYSEIGPFLRSSVFADGPVLDAESVFLLPGSLPIKRNFIKTDGWHSDGWISGEARATLRPQEPSHLTLDGYAADYVFTDAGIPAITLTLELDGAVVATQRLTHGGRFRIQTNVEAEAPGALVLRCGPLHSPRVVGINASDGRELCVIITRTELRRRAPEE